MPGGIVNANDEGGIGRARVFDGELQRGGGGENEDRENHGRENGTIGVP